jgi:hypothetical protein
MKKIFLPVLLLASALYAQKNTADILPIDTEADIEIEPGDK